MPVIISVQFTLTLKKRIYVKVTYLTHDQKIKVQVFYSHVDLYFYLKNFFHPSAGIGRQCKLKLCWL